MPLGNGKLFTVALGGVFRETLQLNEETLFSGQEIKCEKQDGYKYLDQVRQLLFNEEYTKAENLAIEKMVGDWNVVGGLNCYQTLGDLNFSFQYPNFETEVSDYYRELDLQTAVARVEYTIGGVQYKREIFSSAPEQAIYIKFSANKPQSLNFKMVYDRLNTKVTLDENNTLLVKGEAFSVVDPTWGGMRFQTHIIPELNSGKLTPCNNGFIVSQADEVILKLVAATDFQGRDPQNYVKREFQIVISIETA